MSQELKRLAEKAIQVQDACNLSGVVHSWSDVMTDLWKIAHSEKKGTEWVNTNPISFLFAYKCMALAGFEPLSAPFDKAYLEALQMVQEEVNRAI